MQAVLATQQFENRTLVTGVAQDFGTLCSLKHTVPQMTGIAQ
jgi:hypothetical protein